MGWELPRFPQDGKFPKLGKFPNTGNFPGILVREIPGREKFEAIQEGGNGNFPLNITGCHWPLLAVASAGPLILMHTSMQQSCIRAGMFNGKFPFPPSCMASNFSLPGISRTVIPGKFPRFGNFPSFGHFPSAGISGIPVSRKIPVF